MGAKAVVGCCLAGRGYHQAYQAVLLAGLSPESATARTLRARIPGSPTARALLRVFEQDEKTLDYPPGDRTLRPLVDRVYDWLFSRHFLEPPLTTIHPGQHDRVRHCASMDGNAIWYSVRLGLEDGRTAAGTATSALGSPRRRPAVDAAQRVAARTGSTTPSSSTTRCSPCR